MNKSVNVCLLVVRWSAQSTDLIQPECKSCYLWRSRGMRKLTGRNEDADGHTLHLGPSPKVNNVQGAIWLRLGRGKGGRMRQWVEGRVATSTSIWKSRFFLSLQQSAKANVSMRCVHAWLCCARHHHLALLAQPPSIGSSDTVDPLPRVGESITGLRIVHMHAYTPTPPALPALFHTRDTKKSGPCFIWQGTAGEYLQKKQE